MTRQVLGISGSSGVKTSAQVVLGNMRIACWPAGLLACWTGGLFCDYFVGYKAGPSPTAAIPLKLWTCLRHEPLGIVPA